MNNNNSQAVKRLSLRSLNANRTRNAFAMLAIVLTTFMISTVFSIGISFGKNMSVMTDRLAGTTANIFLTHPTDEQIAFVRGLEGVEAAGMQYAVGALRGETADGKALAVSVLGLDKTEWEKHIQPCVANVNGTYPAAENGVMLSQKALAQLNITQPEIGMEIPLNYRSNGKMLNGMFVLSGWFDEYDATQTKGMALFSESCCTAAGLVPEEDGRLCISVSRISAGSVYDAIKAKVGEDNSNLSSSFSAQRSDGENSIVIIGTIVMIALFIVFSGYLLIYNIMYISVTKDIRFYGMLKTIGTSPKQIKSIVLRQAFTLSCIGIPTGILLGLAASFLIVPAALSSLSGDDLRSSAMPAEISFSALIFIGTALFSLLTIAVSCRKPAKLASKVSPVEAVKYTGIKSKAKKKTKKSENGGKLHRMALHNVFREKKRAAIVLASLFMGTITFLSVNSAFSSLDVENFIRKYNKFDFSYQSSPPIAETKFDSGFLAELNGIDGIKYKEIVRADYVKMPFDEELFRPVLEYSVTVYDDLGTVDDLAFAMKNMESRMGYGTWAFATPEVYLEELEGFDAGAFRRGEICFVGYGDYTDMIGKTLEVTSETTGVKKSVRIAGVLGEKSDCNFGNFSYTVGTLAGIFVSDGFIDSLNADAVVTSINFNVKEKAEPSVKAQLEKMNAALTNKTFIFTSRSDVRENFVSSLRTMNILMGGISLLLILIGAINFVNVMTTGIYARRHELAVLESIGMTKNQIRKMLVLEGGCYAAITSLLVLTLGNAIMFMIGSAMPRIADYADFVYPWQIVLVLIVSIFAVCLVVPPLVYKVTAKESVTERLHGSEL